jgi:hypothetical protein
MRRRPLISKDDKVALDRIREDWSEAEAEMKYAVQATTLPKNWEQVKARILSGNTRECSVCGSIERLTIHHRDGNERNNKPGNLVPLCLGCHDKLPVPPFSEAFYCQTMQLGGDRSICLRLGVRGGERRSSTCEFFSGRHGCLLVVMDIVQGENRFHKKPGKKGERHCI